MLALLVLFFAPKSTAKWVQVFAVEMIRSCSRTSSEKFRIELELVENECINSRMNSSAHGFAVLCEIDQWKTSLAFVDIWHHSQSHCDVTWQFSKSQPTEFIITSTWYCTLSRIHSLCEWREVIVALKDFYSCKKMIYHFPVLWLIVKSLI